MALGGLLGPSEVLSSRFFLLYQLSRGGLHAVKLNSERLGVWGSNFPESLALSEHIPESQPSPHSMGLNPCLSLGILSDDVLLFANPCLRQTLPPSRQEGTGCRGRREEISMSGGISWRSLLKVDAPGVGLRGSDSGGHGATQESAR